METNLGNDHKVEFQMVEIDILQKIRIYILQKIENISRLLDFWSFEQISIFDFDQKIESLEIFMIFYFDLLFRSSEIRPSDPWVRNLTLFLLKLTFSLLGKTITD